MKWIDRMFDAHMERARKRWRRESDARDEKLQIQDLATRWGMGLDEAAAFCETIKLRKHRFQWFLGERYPCGDAREWRESEVCDAEEAFAFAHAVEAARAEKKAGK